MQHPTRSSYATDSQYEAALDQYDAALAIIEEENTMSSTIDTLHTMQELSDGTDDALHCGRCHIAIDPGYAPLRYLPYYDGFAYVHPDCAPATPGYHEHYDRRAVLHCDVCLLAIGPVYNDAHYFVGAIKGFTFTHAECADTALYEAGYPTRGGELQS